MRILAPMALAATFSFLLGSCLGPSRSSFNETWQGRGYHMESPGITLSVKQLHAWEGRTFGELRNAYGLPTSSSLGEWVYRPRRLPNLHSKPTSPSIMPLENYPPILVVDTSSGQEFPWVYFQANVPITPNTFIRKVRMVAPSG